MNETYYDVVIVGGGPGGLAAAQGAKEAGASSVLVLEREDQVGGILHQCIHDGFGLIRYRETLTGPEYAHRAQGEALAAGAHLRTGAMVTHLTPDRRLTAVTRQGLLHCQAGAVVLATGAHPRELGLPGERELRGRGVSYCATCDGMFYRGKTVVVVGGGNTAVSDVLYLSRLCEKVYLVHRRDTLRASKVYLDPLQKAENVEFVWDSEVKQLLRDQAVTGVRVRNKKTGKERDIPCDGVFVAVGYLPNTQLYRGQVELDEAGYVLADETTQTNLPGVFAVGDLRKKPLRQVVTAASDGAVAAHFIEEYLNQ